MSGYDEIPPDHDCKKEITEEKSTNTPNPNNDAQLHEWAEKIYRTSEKIYRELIRLRFLMDKPEQKEKFLELMHEKQFGKFIFTFKSKSQLGLYLRIGGHEMATDYCPSRHHIEKIKKFLAEQKENWLEVTQQIIMNLGVIPIVARLIRRNILYPEFEEMEKKIAELKKKIEEKNEQLRLSLKTWLYLAHGIESDMRNALPRIYALMNEMEKK